MERARFSYSTLDPNELEDSDNLPGLPWRGISLKHILKMTSSCRSLKHDPLNMTSSEVANDPDCSSEVGLASNIFEGCLELFAELLKTARRLGMLSDIQDGQLYRQLEGFLLWGDGFNSPQGELDKILDHSKSLKVLVLQLLSAIGHTLLRRKSINRTSAGILTVPPNN
jgi:hypothetical protein